VIGEEVKFILIIRISPNDSNQLTSFVTSNAYMSDSEFECDISTPIVSQENSRNISFLRNDGRRYVIFEFYSYTDHYNASMAFKRMNTKPVIVTVTRSNLRFYCNNIIEKSTRQLQLRTVSAKAKKPSTPCIIKYPQGMSIDVDMPVTMLSTADGTCEFPDGVLRQVKNKK